MAAPGTFNERNPMFKTTEAAAPGFDPENTSIRAILPVPQGGYVAMSGFPGLETAFDGEAYIDPDSMGETLSGLRKAGATSVIILAEEAEFPPGTFQLLQKVAGQVTLDIEFLPIEDFSVPDATFMESWELRRPALFEELAGGGTVAVCCQYGAGRSGLIAAYILIESGVPADQAITQVRQHFDEAIESKEQEVWLYQTVGS